MDESSKQEMNEHRKVKRITIKARTTYNPFIRAVSWLDFTVKYYFSWVAEYKLNNRLQFTISHVGHTRSPFMIYVIQGKQIAGLHDLYGL